MCTWVFLYIKYSKFWSVSHWNFSLSANLLFLKSDYQIDYYPDFIILLFPYSIHDESRKKQCPYCEYRHQYKFLLEVHIDKKHPETGEKAHYCNICEKGFIFPYSAKYCMMKHKENNVSYLLCIFNSMSLRGWATLQK